MHYSSVLQESKNVLVSAVGEIRSALALETGRG